MRKEIHITVKDGRGVIREKIRVKLPQLFQTLSALPYFRHWLFGGIRRKIAERVLAELQNLKNEAGKGE